MSAASNYTEPVNFKNSVEEPATKVATKAPQCIQELPDEVPSRPSLNDSQWVASKPDLQNKQFTNLAYPRTLKLHTDPPLSGQHIGLFSFIPSKNAKPDVDGCFGVLKLRGNFDDEKRADVYSENLIRNHDSYAVIDYTWVGKPIPLMADNTLYRASTREIDVRRKTTEVMSEELKAKRENEKRDMMEVQKRHKALLSDVKETEEKYDDIEYYTQLRVRMANLKYREEDLKKRIEESKEILKAVRTEIEALDTAHPSYKDQCLDKYKEALNASGIDLGSNPLIRYMMD